METLIAFSVASILTLIFVWRYMKRAAVAVPAAAAPQAGKPCPRCSSPVTLGAAFCASCGAPMALWNVSSAGVSNGSAAPAGALRPLINASLCIGCGSCITACPEQGTLALVSGKAILAHPERCKAHADCVTACPTNGISMSAGGGLRTLRVPLVNQNFESNVPGLYIAGELGGLGLIKTSINEGRLVADQIEARARAAAPVPDGAYDAIIVGAGPAGLSASLSLHQAGLRYLTLEQGEIASTIRNYPRHKLLMAEPIEMPLYGNLYIADSTKEALLDVWQSIIANTGVRVRTNEKVEAITRQPSGLFEVRTPIANYLARFVVLAIGKRGTPRRLGVPGEELAHVAYRLIEADTYQGEDVLVVGGGDSALEAALGLSRAGRNRVTLSYRGASINRARQRNLDMLHTAVAEGRVELLLESHVRAIEPGSARLDTPAGPRDVPASYVFILAGGESPDEFLRRSGVEIVEKEVAA